MWPGQLAYLRHADRGGRVTPNNRARQAQKAAMDDLCTFIQLSVAVTSVLHHVLRVLQKELRLPRDADRRVFEEVPS